MPPPLRFRLLRSPTHIAVTIGKLHLVNLDDTLGQFLCFTAEDPIRERPGVPVEDWKLPGITAIPQGEYVVVIDYSYRFKRDLPRLLAVPGFAGIRLHPGNTGADTEGCILPGYTAVTGVGVTQSRLAMDEIQRRMLDAIREGRTVELALVNPPPPVLIPAAGAFAPAGPRVAGVDRPLPPLSDD